MVTLLLQCCYHIVPLRCDRVQAGYPPLVLTLLLHCCHTLLTLFLHWLGVIVYKLATLLLFKLKIDDPLDAAPVHGFCGIWGALAPGNTTSNTITVTLSHHNRYSLTS
jgi:hypothetical protein